MTLLAEIVKQQINYKPTVADKIQRILYRLDQGEPLNQGGLKLGDQYCIMGLFADESGLGYWEEWATEPDCYSYVVGPQRTGSTLTESLAEYYDLRSVGGTFDITDLPDDLLKRLKSFLGRSVPYIYSLMEINDETCANPYEVNQLLRDIIISKVVFNSYVKEK